MIKTSQWILNLFLLIVFTEQVHSQITFSGKVEGVKSAGIQIILEYFDEDSWKNLINIPINTDGTYNAQVKFPRQGQYRIRLNADPKKWSDFWLPASRVQQPLELNFNRYQLDGNPIALDNSPEQRAYVRLVKEYNRVLLNQDTLDRKKWPYLKREIGFAVLCDSIRKACPGTFPADVLALTLPVHVTDTTEAKKLTADSLRRSMHWNIFSGAKTFSPLLKYHASLQRRVQVSATFFDEIKRMDHLIDVLMKKVLNDEALTSFMFRFLLDKMIDYRNEPGLSYLLTWYADDCAEGSHSTQETKNLVAALENCAPGKTIEFLTLPDSSGKMISSKEVYAKNKVTILLFWKASCSHCKEFEPKLEGLFEKYHPQGLGVYAIGTDPTMDEWKVQNSINDSPWPSVFLAMDQRRDFNKRFPVPGTPALMAVDSQGKIISRMLMRGKIEELIREMLGLPPETK